MIPIEFQKLEELNNTECMVLAIYRYYTVEGDLHYCSLSNEDICKMVRLKDTSNLRRIKNHLKELGYIRTDGGIKVTYVGISGEDIKVQKEDIKTLPGEDIKVQKMDIKVQGEDINVQKTDIKVQKTDINVLHKEEKRKEEIKKEKRSELTNYDLLLEKLPDTYKTPEKISYIKEHFMERINSVKKDDLMSSGGIDTWIVNIKNILNKEYPTKPVIKQQEHKSTTDDLISGLFDTYL